VESVIVRLVVSPPLSPHALDGVSGAIPPNGRLLAARSDGDVNASVVSAAAEHDAVAPLIARIVEVCKGNVAAGRAFRLDLQTESPDSFTDEALRPIAVNMHGSLMAPVYIARRREPAAAWGFTRPMPWGRKGLSVGQVAPSLPYGGAECLGVAMEVGKPSVIVKARLEGVPEHGLLAACAAVGGAESGFAEVGAYAAVSAADGASVVVLEFGNLKRSPLHRALAVLDLEAARYGGRLGQTALLSHVPLDSLLDVLRSATGLDAAMGQVLETHLSASQG
jgi:hypothetical protein